MNNSNLSKRLNSFPKSQKLNIETKTKIVTILQEEIKKEEQVGKWNGIKGIIKKSRVYVAGVAAVFLFSLLLFSIKDFDFNLGTKNQINGTEPSSQKEEVVTDGLSSKNEQPTSVVQYENKEYGFIFSLPDSWKGYQIVTDEWEGIPNNSENSNEKQEKGPILLIRHPKWTSETPRQDIPIMIFTTSQWNALQQEEFHIGAAPIGPTELDHNNKYVFALPARYNFAFPEGYEEVEEIIAKKPLSAKKLD